MAELRDQILVPVVPVCSNKAGRWPMISRPAKLARVLSATGA